MDHYQEEITGNMIAEYQYMLNILVSEMDSKYKLKGMLSLLKFAKEVETDSRYVSLKLSDDDVVISSAYASKFGLSIGDSITLKEKYEDKTYTFTVTQIYPYEASLVVFLSRDHLNDVFDLGKDMYGGIFPVLIFAVLVYLLSKIIIEKNAAVDFHGKNSRLLQRRDCKALCYANLNCCRALRADQYSAERQDYRYHLESNAVTNDDGVPALLD